jgi:hypothetical protein
MAGAGRPCLLAPLSVLFLAGTFGLLKWNNKCVAHSLRIALEIYSVMFALDGRLGHFQSEENRLGVVIGT